MKKDNSKMNFNYPGISIEEVTTDPDEYIVPECLDACKSFWDKNIFTVSCSNRNEKKDASGKVLKYIMINNLSDENLKIFNQLAKSNPLHYRSIVRYERNYYVIVISSTDSEQDRDLDSEAFLNLVLPFEMQDCLEGFVDIKDYYLDNLLLNYYPTDKSSISISDQELTAAVKKYLDASGKLNLLDLDRGVVYDSIFYKKAHQKYLDYLRNFPSTSPDSHDDR